MKNRVLATIIFLLAAAGVADTTYLTYAEHKPEVASYSCGASEVTSGAKIDCNQVLDSDYAYIGPVHLSDIGLVYYLALSMLALTQILTTRQPYWLGKKLRKSSLLKKHPWLKLATLSEVIFLISLAGLLFSAYLVYLMAFVIGAWCYFCLLSAATTSLIFIINAIYLHQRYLHSPFLLKKLQFAFISFFYRHLLKPIAFLFEAERVHNCITQVGVLLGRCRFLKCVTKIKLSFSHPKLNRQLLGIKFSNPVGLSAGFDYNGQLTQILPSVGFGWHTIGTVTLEPYEGNSPPRLGRFPDSKALLVNKGLKSKGAKAVIRELKKVKFHIPTAISIASTNKHFKTTHQQILDILTTFKLFEKSGLKHALYELNISCPNTFGGEPFTSCPRLDVLLSALDKLNLSRPVLIKMPIDQGEKETLAMLKVINKHNIAGVIFGNLTKDKNNPAITQKDRKRWQKLKGNLSGKPTFERSNRLIKLTKKHFSDRFVIVGTGGIFNGEDALTKLKLGADLVQLITGMIYTGPQVVGEINLEVALKLKNTNGKRNLNT